MLGKFVIPVVNTEKGKFEYSGKLSREEFGQMVYDNFARNNARIQKLADSIQNETTFDYGNRRIVNHYKEFDLVETPVEALFLNKKKKEYDIKDFENVEESGKMSILLVNINPEEFDQDAESELKYWMADTNKVLKDEDISDRTKLETISKMTFGCEIDGRYFILQNCKMFEDYSDKKYPYYFALIVEKIIEIK